jgi:hypothetical protein
MAMEILVRHSECLNYSGSANTKEDGDARNDD